MLNKTKPPVTWPVIVALGRPYRQTGVLTFHLGRQRSLHFMVVAARRKTVSGNKAGRYAFYTEWVKYLRKEGRGKRAKK